MRRLHLSLAIALALVAAPALAARPGALGAFDAKIDATKQAMMGDPMLAKASAEGAVTQAKALATDPAVKPQDATVALATAQWLLGEAMIGLNKPEVARTLILQALAAAQSAAPGTKLHGDLLRSRAALAEATGNVQGALADYMAAYKIFRAAGVSRSEAIALQDIGNLYLTAGDFDRVRSYYSQSLDAYDKDPWLNLATYNNRGQAYREQNKLAEAQKEYRLALTSARELESPLLEARILTNLADAQVEAGQIGDALKTLDAADPLVRTGEGTGWRAAAYATRGKIAAKQGDWAGAGRWFGLAFAGQPLDKTEMPFREFHRAAAAVYEHLGQTDLALAHTKAFQRLDSEALRLTASASSQLMSARFDFTNQNLRISKLKQGQLERDILIERQRARIFQGVGFALSVIFALLLFGYVSIRRSRNQVRAANTELNTTNVQLEKALKARTDFLAMTSHEIRTPLNGILGMSQVLLADQRMAPDMRERVQVLMSAGDTMRSLVDDILDVAKIEAEGVQVDLAEASLSRLLGETVTLWKEAAAAKGLAFTATLDAVPERVLTGSDRVKQILSNLLSNAIKFTPQGNVALKVRRTDGGCVAFAVRDTGIGIPAEDCERIFEPFIQVNNSTTRDFSGTGLGLAISRRLAQALGGDIAVESVLGEGSCFTVTLPMEALGDELASLESNMSGSLSEAALLVVEPKAEAHALMRMLLAPETKSVETVASIEGAAQRLAAARFDHVLVEGNAGADIAVLRDFIETVRAHGALASLLAAPSDDLPASQLLTAGADQVILKPVGAADLIAALKKAYEKDYPNLNPAPLPALREQGGAQ